MSSIKEKRALESSTCDEWTRSASIQTDLIRIYERGDYHDCSFEILSEQPESGGKKVFKCHKLFLSTVSCVFAKMLHSHFKEARLGPDDPIPLHKVDPEVFECAMRFIYGQEKNFKNVDFAVEVYKFAHEMQITSLKFAVNNSIKNLGSINGLPVLDFCIQFDNKEGLQICKDILGESLSEVLESKKWLSVSEAVMQKVLQMNELGISESEVAMMLLEWGRVQVEADGHESSDYARLRQKIDSSLKFVRWPQFEGKQFIALCQGEFGKLFDAEFKFQVICCIVKKDWSKLPQQLQPVCLEQRK